MPLRPGDLILEPGEFRLLESLRLNPRKTTAGRVRGERLTRRKGISIEFADFRDYVDGDDVRHLDWNVLARMDSSVIRTYQDEEDLSVHLLLDRSSSMSFGELSKFEQAKRIAATLGYLALGGRDALYPKAVGSRDNPMSALRGKSSYLRYASWISEQRPDGNIPLVESLKSFAGGKSRPGLAVIISDGLDPRAPEAVASVGGRGHEIMFVQILALEEIDPDIEGDLRLLDSETNSQVEITANSQAVREYRNALSRHCDSLAAATRRVGGRFVQINSRTSLEDFVKNGLKRGGWVA